MPKQRKAIALIDEFRDDHLPCVEFSYGEGVFKLWWTDTRTIGALSFPDSPAAQDHLKGLLDALDGDASIETDDDGGSHTEWGYLEWPKQAGAEDRETAVARATAAAEHEDDDRVPETQPAMLEIPTIPRTREAVRALQALLATLCCDAEEREGMERLSEEADDRLADLKAIDPGWKHVLEDWHAGAV